MKVKYKPHSKQTLKDRLIDKFWHLEEYYWHYMRLRICFKCKRIRLQIRCENCSKFYCTKCCEWDYESGDYGGQGFDYPICPHCDE